jgi:hypothetical protein
MDGLISLTNVARTIGNTVTSLRKLEAIGCFPVHVSTQGREWFYRLPDVERWLFATSDGKVAALSDVPANASLN